MTTNFKQLFEDRHAYAEAWKKRTGGLVLAYFDPYFPEELAYAAGMLPVRVMAQHEPDDISTKWIYSSCYPVRDMANQFFLGRYDYMDALVNTEACQWYFNLFEVLQNNFPKLKEQSYHLFLPDYPEAPTSRTLLLDELQVLKAKFEKWTGREITDESLDNAIEIYNKNRRLLRKIYELRREYESPILGSEAMYVLLADQVMDKAEMNALLEAFLEELERREPYKDRIRLMRIGSETWDAKLEELVEACGANIVIDELDNGTSYCWNEIIPQKDRLYAIGLRYLGKPHGSLKDSNWRRRPQHIFEMAEDWLIDGALIVKQVYCHPHGSDNYAIWKLLRERYMPYHYMEIDHAVNEAETRLRIESLMAILKPGLVRLRGWHVPDELQER